MTTYDRAMYIGRFSPFHTIHRATAYAGLEIADTLHFLIGSTNIAPNIRCPWSFEERCAMIASNFSQAEQSRLRFSPIGDHLYNDNAWIAEVQQAAKVAPGEAVALLGADKDSTSYYLGILPFLKRVPTEVVPGVDATSVRMEFFRNQDMNGCLTMGSTTETNKWLTDWAVSNVDEFARLRREWLFIEQYKKLWANSPYPVQFMTTDMVVICCGHVLMVRRKAAPGEGLLALPGGYLEKDLTFYKNALKELREETKIDVPDKVITGSIVRDHDFDHPMRSLRGRTVTKAYYVQLNDTVLPKVKGGSDARSAEWIPLGDLHARQREIFEDHSMIIEFFTGNVHPVYQ